MKLPPDKYRYMFAVARSDIVTAQQWLQAEEYQKADNELMRAIRALKAIQSDIRNEANETH